MPKAPKLVVHERMSQGEGVKGPKEKKRGPRWSAEEMKEQPNTDKEKYAEELTKWRCLNQREMDSCWNNLVERMEQEVLDKYKVEESKKEAFRGRAAAMEWRRVRENKTYRIRKWEKIAGQEFLPD